VVVALVLLRCAHRQLQILVYLNIGGEHQPAIASVYPRRLGFHLGFGDGELLEEGGVEFWEEFGGFDEGVGEGHGDGDLCARDLHLRP
jgi:hypothetical protein